MFSAHEREKTEKQDDRQASFRSERPCAWRNISVRRKPSSAAKRAAINAITIPPGFNGVFAYAKGGTIAYTRYAGMTDVEAGKAISPDTQFKWGSASKWLASVTVLRLVDLSHSVTDDAQACGRCGTA